MAGRDISYVTSGGRACQSSSVVGIRRMYVQPVKFRGPQLKLHRSCHTEHHGYDTGHAITISIHTWCEHTSPSHYHCTEEINVQCRPLDFFWGILRQHWFLIDICPGGEMWRRTEYKKVIHIMAMREIKHSPLGDSRAWITMLMKPSLRSGSSLSRSFTRVTDPVFSSWISTNPSGSSAGEHNLIVASSRISWK